MLFSCEVCGHRYPSISGLKKHIQINHDEAPALQNQVVIIVSVNIVLNFFVIDLSWRVIECLTQVKNRFTVKFVGTIGHLKAASEHI
jgi:hypothetical protein